MIIGFAVIIVEILEHHSAIKPTCSVIKIDIKLGTVFQYVCYQTPDLATKS